MSSKGTKQASIGVSQLLSRPEIGYEHETFFSGDQL
jgi:hypothetical protein